MNKFMLAVFLLALSSTSCSATTEEKLPYADKVKLCKEYEEFVESVAKAKFNGLSLSQIITATMEHGLTEDGSMMQLIYIVYEMPNLMTTKFQTNAINNLKNEVFYHCMNEN